MDYPHQEKINFVKSLLKKTKTYSLSERKIAVQLTNYFELNPEMTYYLMNQWITQKLFYRTVHRNHCYIYSRWSFKFK